jgi:hypothetical protein
MHESKKDQKNDTEDLVDRRANQENNYSSTLPLMGAHETGKRSPLRRLQPCSPGRVSNRDKARSTPGARGQRQDRADPDQA